MFNNKLQELVALNYFMHSIMPSKKDSLEMFEKAMSDRHYELLETEYVYGKFYDAVFKVPFAKSIAFNSSSIKLILEKNFPVICFMLYYLPKESNPKHIWLYRYEELKAEIERLNITVTDKKILTQIGVIKNEE